MKKNIVGLALISILLYIPAALAGGPIGNVGSYSKWAKVEINLPGPVSTSTGNPNPFIIDVDVTFTAPSGKTYLVPGFFDGDGIGSADGSVWKVRFSADEVGNWSFASQSANTLLNGHTGSFTATAAPSNAADFYRWGRLESIGAPGNDIRYLKFRDGAYWLKAGSDDPENFLGNFSNYNTPAKRKAVIDYLSSRGINSQYLISQNIDGDGKDVWPWLGATAAAAKLNAGSNVRYNVQKLEEWRDLFEYMQSKSVVVYMILEDDFAWTGFNRARYYRELIARFSYLPALLFNIGEEANESYSSTQTLGFAQQLKALDPFDHPIGIHNVPLWPVTTPSDSYINSSAVDFTSLQTKGTNPLIHNKLTIDWLNRAKALGRRTPMVNFDEARPILNRKAWWSAYLAGGVWEAHVAKPYDRPINTWETVWNQLGGTRAFMESVPFWEMQASNALLTSGSAYVLAKVGQAYALYLPNGGSVNVDLAAGKNYQYGWWNPNNSQTGVFQNTGTTTGGNQTFTAPAAGDWALRIMSTGTSSIGPSLSQIATGTYPDIFVDKDGIQHVVYARAGKLRYTKFVSGAWVAEQDTGIVQFASYRNDPDIAVDSLGRPHVVGGQGDGTGQYAYWNGTQWIIIPLTISRDTSLAIDSLDNVYVISRSGNNGGYMALWRRSAGSTIFTAMPDPDNANGLPLGRNQNVYGHIFISPNDNTLNIVYRHGVAPLWAAYRSSADGGATWSGGGISGDDVEAPSGIAGADGTAYVITGDGNVYSKGGGATTWTSMGRAVTSVLRNLPNLAIDTAGNLYAASFGGKFNIYTQGAWVGEQTLTSLTGNPIGFMEISCAGTSCYAIWEEGAAVLAVNDNIQQAFSIVVSPLTMGGVNNGNTDTMPPAAPTGVSVQ